ncbi:unnamed protein product [Heterobilharzia americana]|nr:unnamed protein product [Heterobilharzia americana]
MSVSSSSTDLQISHFEQCSTYKSTGPSIKRTCYSELVEYEIIKEVMLDLAYENEIGLLTCCKSDVYNMLNHIWVDCHYIEGAKKACSVNTKECRGEIINNAILLLHRRIEEKLNERLTLLADCDQALLELERLQAAFTQITEEMYPTLSTLCREFRCEVHPRLSFQVLSVLNDQADALLLRAQHLQEFILYSASQPSETLDILKEIHIELVDSRTVLQQEVKELEELLEIYNNKDKEYHEIVEKYIECQQQLLLRSKLLKDTDSIVTTPTHLNEVSYHEVSRRRSMSADMKLKKKESIFT